MFLPGLLELRVKAGRGMPTMMPQPGQETYLLFCVLDTAGVGTDAGELWKTFLRAQNGAKTPIF
jgi:hypothetical protein